LRLLCLQDEEEYSSKESSEWRKLELELEEFEKSIISLLFVNFVVSSSSNSPKPNAFDCKSNKLGNWGPHNTEKKGKQVESWNLFPGIRLI
jgi:hypothetical protein